MLWLKTIGIAFTIAGFGGWGLARAGKLTRRAQQLRELRMAIDFLEKDISYAQMPLSRAMERTANFCHAPVAQLFQESAYRLKNRAGITAREAWQEGLKVLGRDSDLHNQDIELLATAALQLGMSDAASQRNFFILLQEEIKILETRALQEVDSGHKLWSYGGFILGAVVVLLFI